MTKRKKKTKKINLSDDFRILETEVLPYEVPIWLSNRGFHIACSKNIITYDEHTINLFSAHIKELDITIPLEYQIAKDDSNTRKIGIMHPLSQLKVVDFYKKYGNIIPYYCQQSQASLRYPGVIAKSIRSSDDALDEAEAMDDCADRRPHDENDVSCINFLDTYCSAYYVYRQVNFFYKFFESYEFHRLEKKYSKYIQVDVAKCFDSIYTHSIAWSIKGKHLAKKIAFANQNTFESSFDNLMQRINYRETHGILVGPELSRIFAEIIFQRVDNNLIASQMSNSPSWACGKDYEFKRYVDDYVIFYNDTNCAEQLLINLRKALSEYKMYLNDSKTQYLKRPFISNISLCKLCLREYLQQLYGERYNNEGLLKKISTPSRTANSIIVKIKSIIKAHEEVSYKSISGFLLSEFSRYFKKFIKKSEQLSEDQYETLQDYILIDLDVVFFIHSMDVRVRPTDVISRITLNLIRSPLLRKTNCLYGAIHKKIFDSCRNTLDNKKCLNGNNCIELCNILLLLSALDENFKIDQLYLWNIFNLDVSLEINYFVWISLMLYCKNRDDYEKITNRLLECLKKKLTDTKNSLRFAEHFMLFLDSMACPYVPLAIKQEIVDFLRSVAFVEVANTEKRDSFIDGCVRQSFFVDWKNNDWLFEMSKRKMYIFPYE